MEMLSRIEDFRPPPQGTALSIGTFDGVHRGHAAVLAAARQSARSFGGESVAITFEPHPLALLAPERNPERLNTAGERAALLSRHVDRVITLPTTRELLAHSAESFLRDFLLPCRPRVIVEGPDFHFGKDRKGSARTLREGGARHGFTVQEVPEQIADSLPGRPPIRSSLVREFLKTGQVRDVSGPLLGRAYRIVGRVGHGQGRGAGLRFPTANLDAIPHLIPRHGVYAALAQTQNQGNFMAAVNIGPQPTFAQMDSRVEAHLLDFDGDLRGQLLGLHLLDWLRDQTRFEGVAALVAQLQQDCEATRSRGAWAAQADLISLLGAA